MIKILLDKGYSPSAGMGVNYLEIDGEMDEEYGGNKIYITFEKDKKSLTKVKQRITIDLTKKRIIYSYTPNMWKGLEQVISKKDLIVKLKALPKPSTYNVSNYLKEEHRGENP